MVKSPRARYAGTSKAAPSVSHLSGGSCSSGWRCPPPRSARGVPRTSTRRSYLPCPSLLNVREYHRAAEGTCSSSLLVDGWRRRRWWWVT
ncbi:hypothetical protein PUN28_016031 [Cardiocondyla obscurior]|uniref:Uncharacterized protein n=1 Tax=Cardiocondyla obscurior TaxID=286306 RepID=A0AAW2EVX2_9HYME